MLRRLYPWIGWASFLSCIWLVTHQPEPIVCEQPRTAASRIIVGNGDGSETVLWTNKR